MNCLDFSSEELTFNYKNKGHLDSSLVITNNSDTHAYFKFKVTRPKFYLIKPDHGFIAPHTSLTIAITLHEQGVSEGEGDKFKLYYRYGVHTQEEPLKGWQKQELSVLQNRFTVVINGLPDQFKRTSDKVKSSEVKSITSSRFGQNSKSNMTTLDNIVQDRQKKLASLKNQVEELKTHTGKLTKSTNNLKLYLIVGCIGLALGLLSSLWI